MQDSRYTNKNNLLHVSHWIDVLAKKTPFNIAQKLTNITPLIPYYHMISNEKIPHVCHLYSYKNEKQFEEDLEFLCTHYEPISLDDIISHTRRTKKLRNGSFLLTFDDGYSQMYSVVAPILYKKGIPAIFFLNSAFVDNEELCYINKASLLIEYIVDQKNNYAEIKKCLSPLLPVSFQDVPAWLISIKYQDKNVLDAAAELLGVRFDDYLKYNAPYLNSSQIHKMIEMGFAFGGHSKDHPLYADLSLEAQLDQTIQSLQFLRRKFSLPYSVFAFPHNDDLVSRDFFRKIAIYADVTFGTGAIKTDEVVTNLQRINFERTLEPAKTILKMYFIKKGILQLARRAHISRH